LKILPTLQTEDACSPWLFGALTARVGVIPFGEGSLLATEWCRGAEMRRV